MKNVEPLKSSRQNEHGYNLLMTSIALMVIGIISVGFISIYELYKKNDDVVVNQSRVTNIVSVIQAYKNKYGRFPCPSSLNAPRSSPVYGAEDCATVIPPGSCTGGICVVNGRTIAAVPQPVRIGSIPFRLLQLDEKETIDSYGARFVYAVTQNQTNVTTFNELIGAIDIVDETGQSIADPTGADPGTVSFSVVSHGPNRYGAFNLQGGQAIACNAGTSEAANCINMASPPAAPYKMVSSLAYLAGGATEFDDTIEYFSSAAPTRWRRTGPDQESIQTISNNNVGMGVSTPVVGLDIGLATAQGAVDGRQASLTGGLLAHTNVSANKICNYAGTFCFQPSDFTASPNPFMDCATSTTKKYMVGIGADTTREHAQAMCDYAKTACPAGQVLIGFNTTGTPKCTVVGSSCPLSTVQICNNANPRQFDIRNSNAAKTNPTSTACINSPSCTHIGSANNGDTYQIWDPNSYPSNYARASFRCNNGNWLYTGSSTGLCSCNPAIPTNSNCTTSPISTTCTRPTSCAGQGSGTATYSYTYNPASCGWSMSSTANYAACTCPTTPSIPAPSTSSCGSGNGSNGTNWNWNSSNSVCNWQATCTCTPPPSTTQTLTTAVACNTPAPSGPGLAGYTGNAFRTQNFNASVGTCKWQDSGWDTSGCTCDTSAPPFSEPTTDTCNSACQNVTTTAKNWYVYKIVGGACVKTLDSTTPSVCAPKSFSWKINATQIPTRGQSNYGTSPAIGEPCNQSCMTTNAVGSGSACWQAGDNAKYDIFTCICLQN